jgi:hypothetical protein
MMVALPYMVDEPICVNRFYLLWGSCKPDRISATLLRAYSLSFHEYHWRQTFDATSYSS